MATYTETYCNASTGSNINGGSDSGSPSMSDTAGTGSWTSGTATYLSISTSGTVTVGQFLSVYTSGATSPSMVARIISVSGGSGVAWTIGVSTTAYAGTAPGTLTSGSTYLAQVGGAWAGPTGTVGWPFSAANLANLTDASGDPIRVNLQNGTTYSISTGLTTASAGPVTVSGYTSSAGDGGRATISGSTNAIVLITSSQANWTWRDLILSSAATSGTSDAFKISSRGTVERVTATGARGNGFNCTGASVQFVECEAYLCNGSNTASTGGMTTSQICNFLRCTSHHNAGTNSFGFNTSNYAYFQDCIAAENGGVGYLASGSSAFMNLNACDAYHNTSDGFKFSGTSNQIFLDNCNLLRNGGYGVNNSGGATNQIRLSNCGDYNNTSGRLGGTLGVILDTGFVTYTADPTVNGSNGNFAMSLSTALGAGRGVFFLASAEYSASTTSYPDIGAVQNIDVPIIAAQNITQYLQGEGDY